MDRFDLGLLFSLRGRISRFTFWVTTVLLWAGGVICSATLQLVVRVGGLDGSLLSFLFGLAEMALLVAWLAGSLATHTKRWHDRGKSGWWVLLWLVPVVGQVWTIVELGFLGGTRGDNKYGHVSGGSSLEDRPRWQERRLWGRGPTTGFLIVAFLILVLVIVEVSRKGPFGS